MSHCVFTDGSPNVSGGGSDDHPASGLQNAAEVSATLLAANAAPSESSRAPEAQQPSPRSKKKDKHHHSNHRHRSPNKKTSKGKHKWGKTTTGRKKKKKEEEEEEEGQRQRSGGHRHRHRSPDKAHGRSRSAGNALDDRNARRRSPDKHRAARRSSPQRHRSSPHRSPRRHRSPHRHGSPQRARHRHHHSPTRRHAHSSDPYRASPERRAHSNEKPRGGGADEALRAPRERSFSLEDSVLREPPALDRLNREDTLPPLRRDARPYAEDSLLLSASSVERGYKGDSLLRDLASRGRRDAAVPRARSPDSDAAFQKYSSLLRGRASPERAERDARFAGRERERSPAAPPQYRARSLGRDISPIGSSRGTESEDEEDDDMFVAAKVREYYSTLQSGSSGRPAARAAPPPEPRKTYKESPKDLSI
ncbi:pre-mRNA-splicing factor 38B-like [Pseudoliparis swirei]|uniref:pre-mRNA-splicing factor 38B-like n=1 Tax=Pseudoliparis swirei TaxID=2059687 RepID=UPI0024BEFF27|nr:pre-mRNA-splicing factor 38B-like [Pseudoliparis swirei]